MAEIGEEEYAQLIKLKELFFKQDYLQKQVNQIREFCDDIKEFEF